MIHISISPSLPPSTSVITLLQAPIGTKSSLDLHLCILVEGGEAIGVHRALAARAQLYDHSLLEYPLLQLGIPLGLEGL